MANVTAEQSIASGGMPMPSLGTDYYKLDELLTPEERAIRDRVRAFSRRLIDVQAELTTQHSIGVIPVTPTRVHDSRTP